MTGTLCTYHTLEGPSRILRLFGMPSGQYVDYSAHLVVSCDVSTGSLGSFGASNVLRIMLGYAGLAAMRLSENVIAGGWG
jgi:hypothetical protein